jgi:acetylglutamate kinase
VIHLPGAGVLVIKVGGAVADLEGALTCLPELLEAGFKVAIVHGGGREISAWMERLALPVRFKDGLRVTDAPAMELATMILCGKVSTALVGALVRGGVRAVGLSGVDGGVFSARHHADPEVGLVGELAALHPALLQLLMQAGFVPVLAPIAEDQAGCPRNINADSACGGVAAALGADLAVFLTDVPGVRDAQGAILPRLAAGDALRLIEEGTIQGGMVPKIRACLLALSQGAGAVCIADGRDRATLRPLLNGGRPTGTVIMADKASDPPKEKQ